MIDRGRSDGVARRYLLVVPYALILPRGAVEAAARDGRIVLDHSGKMFLGACAALIGLGGLFAASHAGHGVGYYGGLAIAVLCVWFVMQLIKTAGDHGGHE